MHRGGCLLLDGGGLVVRLYYEPLLLLFIMIGRGGCQLRLIVLLMK